MSKKELSARSRPRRLKYEAFEKDPQTIVGEEELEANLQMAGNS